MPLTNFRREVSDRLAEIRPPQEWEIGEADSFIGQFIDFLVRFAYPDGLLTQELLDDVFGRLRTAMRANGHQCPRVTSLRQRFQAQAQLAGLGGGPRPGFGNANRSTSSGGNSYEAVLSAGDHTPEDEGECGLYRVDHDGSSCQLTNFCVLLDRDVTVEDDLEPFRRFDGRILLGRRESAFTIEAGDYARPDRLLQRIFEAAGPQALIHCRGDELRNAISAVSTPVPVRQTSNFGWDLTGNTFMVPSGSITVNGFHPVGLGDVRVNLDLEEHARHLDLVPLAPDDLLRVRRHVVDDFLRLHDRRVTCSLLGTVALAILKPFAPEALPFGLWLTGLTGSGKTFFARLAQNFFGALPPNAGLVSWTATPNYIERLGFFFRDAVYVVDDYKPGVARHEQVVRVLQAYADQTGRGRLRSDARTNPSRWIRGQLICTGEDMPESTASAIARSINVKVRQQEKDIERGQRCLSEALNYSGVTLDFIRFVLANGQTVQFASRVRDYQRFFLRDIAGRQNDARIAMNFAQLAAAFWQITAYLADVWPSREETVQEFINVDLVAMRNEMLMVVNEEQESEVFLRILRDLIQLRRFKIDNYVLRRGIPPETCPSIGRFIHASGGEGADRAAAHVKLCTHLALQAVNESLTHQGRPPLRISLRALVGQLRHDGRLVDERGRPIGDHDDPEAYTSTARLDGHTVRTIRMAADTFLDETDVAPEPVQPRSPRRT